MSTVIVPADHSATATAPDRDADRTAAVRWHRPLLWLAVAMAALSVVCGIGMLVDDRTLLGVGVWEKPLKFALSALVYSVTWSWLIGQLQRFRRVAWWAGTIAAGLLVVELVIIVGFAAAGETSHFNVTTPFHTAMWAVMAFSISTLWVATFVVSVILFRNPSADPARSIAVRSGAIIALVGMGLAFLMTGPNADQLSDFQGVAGAHAVGVADGGPGLPLLGWSTVAGDLRIPHFVGMHALQVIPLVLLIVELASRRVPLLRDSAVRARLVTIVAAAYAAVLALLTWQALRGQSIVQPDALTLAVGGAIAAASLVAVLAVVARATTPQRTK
ncbi:hypothetical protein [Antiquaquibacter soli]|uniref:Uncharacterized protein n=1 Tax=Antiquaquibacter soli TaxID=3064523 RepID=A0ABT9BQL9_9MICO|nr:hypothetical protein [Protaetiibacter sp. WY-16]MDO7883320.1 hypothetical protein [Protaetiibacter sp. WY-16]